MTSFSRSKTTVSNQSVFPTKNMVSSQILVTQHLHAHNRRLQNAKAVVDTSLPYSYWNNPTTRGYQRSVKHVHAANSPRIDDEKQSKIAPAFSDDPTVDQIVKSYIRIADSLPDEVKSRNAYSASRNIPESTQYLKKEFPGRKKSFGCASSFQSGKRRPEVGDVLQTYRHRFTPEKPFSPRTIRSSAASKIRGLRCYNPPIRTSRLNSAKCQKNEDERIRPSSALETNLGLFDCSLNRVARQSPDAAKDEQSFDLMKKPKSSKHHQTSAPSVRKLRYPRLPLSSEPDECYTAQLIPSVEKIRNLDWVDQWIQSLPVCDSDATQLGEARKRIDDGVQAKIDSWKERIEEKQKALLYLSFIEAVTNDVLARGVFTDKNLNSIISEHVARNEFGMSKEQLQQAAEQLRTQLRIKEDDVAFISNNQKCTNKENVQAEDKPPTPSNSRPSVIKESGVCSSPLDPLLAASPSLSARPPKPPAREHRTPGSHSPVDSPSRRKLTEKHLKSSELDSNKKSHRANIDYQTALDQNGMSTGHSKNQISPKNQMKCNQIQENNTHSSNSAAHWSTNESHLDLSDHEDTLNDPATMPNFSTSAKPADSSDSLELDEEPLQTYSFQFEEDDGVKTPESKAQAQSDDGSVDEPIVIPRNKQTRVTFASEAEFFSIQGGNDVTTSVSSLTNLTRLTSPDMTSPHKGEYDLSSLQAIAEGDSNVTFNSDQDNKEYAFPTYENDATLPRNRLTSS